MGVSVGAGVLLMCRGVGAPVTVKVMGGVGGEGEVAEDVFDEGCVFVVAEDAVGALGGCSVGGAAVGDADVGVAGAAEVLEGGLGAGVSDGDGSHRVSWKRMCCPGRRVVGGVVWMFQMGWVVCPMSCQPPGEGWG
ncbi:Uncharacterised protein [Dermatophilus congolensis]|uniref:Uncharacterized protein n=1 Tax=Dermatophilus congolensis TaxID=1863 RepID=A0A239VV80_9MICO|nr:Uncharacterised protein [Dermatophilus congolensis]